MQPFFEPGPFEEYIAQLSSFRAQPPRSVWKGIDQQLNRLARRKRILNLVYSATAASVLIVIGLGGSKFLMTSSEIQPYSLHSGILPIYTPIELPPRNIVKVVDHTPIAIQYYTKAVEAVSGNTQFAEALTDNNLLTNPEPINHEPIVESEVFQNQDSSHAKAFYPSAKDYNTDYSKDVKIIERKRSSQKSSWSLIGYFAPTFLSSAQAPNSQPHNIELPPIMNIGGDILFSKRINETFSLYSGVSVSPTGQNVNNLLLLKDQEAKQIRKFKNQKSMPESVIQDKCAMEIADFSDALKENKSQPTTLEHPMQLQQQFYYVQIPIIVASKFRMAPLSFELKLGGAAGILINNRFESYNQDGQFMEKTEEDRWLNISTLAAVSISYPITPHVDLIVEPHLQWYFNPLSHSYRINHPATASLKFGLGYNF